MTIRKATKLAVLAGTALGAGFLFAPSANATGGPEASDQYANLPAKLELVATIRDFRAKEETGGHKDFQAYSGSTTVGLASDTLDGDGKPSSKSLRGKLISTEYKDSRGRFINPALYDSSKGDVAGVLSNGTNSNGMYSAESFAQWYRDVPGVNVAKNLPLVLNRVPNTNRYVFDSASDEPYKSRNGFFPIDQELYGNYSNSGHNFHFTTELATSFVYEKGKGQVFKFTGDDDVWVYIAGRLAIDLGGLHAKKEQYLDLDRLNWLEDGKEYELKIFHAERRTTQSNFRMETTLKLKAIDAPATAGMFD